MSPSSVLFHCRFRPSSSVMVVPAVIIIRHRSLRLLVLSNCVVFVVFLPRPSSSGVLFVVVYHHPTSSLLLVVVRRRSSSIVFVIRHRPSSPGVVFVVVRYHSSSSSPSSLTLSSAVFCYGHYFVWRRYRRRYSSVEIVIVVVVVVVVVVSKTWIKSISYIQRCINIVNTTVRQLIPLMIFSTTNHSWSQVFESKNGLSSLTTYRSAFKPSYLWSPADIQFVFWLVPRKTHAQMTPYYIYLL